jgi:malonate decarboxylase epsilon subunit
LNTLLLFPGQGAQHVGMLHQLVEHPAVTETLDEMSEALHMDIRSADTTEALKSTVSVQLALLAAGVATARALQQSGLSPRVVAGLSVGTFSAAVIAEAISLKDAALLVRSRAEQMEHLYPSGYGLAAIVGLNEEQVGKLVTEVNTPNTPVFVANINAPRQIVIAGSLSGMGSVLTAARTRGAPKAEILDVSVPSHCPLLQSVSKSLEMQLEAVTVSDPRIVYLSDVGARAIRSAQGVAQDLANNISHSVRWHDATVVAHELGCNLFLEMPPGNTLTRLAQANIPDITALPVATDNFARALNLAESRGVTEYQPLVA